MSVKDVLTSLGSKRTIWIDDFFNDGPERLAAMLLENVEVTRTCEFPELVGPLRTFDDRPAASRERAIAALAEAGEARMRDMKDLFFKARRVMGRSGPELSSGAVDHVCNLLQVRREDRWPFDQAFASLPEVCAGDGDATVNYVVDLNDAMGSTTRGLEILIFLASMNSRGTAFILTHDAATVQEASKELEFRRQIETDAPDLKKLSIPVCVIAKERLFGDPDGTDIEDALRVALKRAGLRRSVHEVLWKAEDSLAAAFQEAAARLTEIPPEQLEDHVVERGYREGVSELHVVERALTAHMAKTLREMFGVDEAVRASAKRMRSLRKVKLKPVEAEPDRNLARFYNAEVWESGTLINKELSPIACGDVFELDPNEPEIGKTKRRYVLLGQPCDISLRPEETKRQQDTAFLICMKTKRDNNGPEKSKEPVLPFRVDGDWWEFQFRTATVARLAILDLASFREDGKVCVDVGHVAPDGLLDGLAFVHGDRVAASDRVLKDVLAEQAATEERAAARKTAAEAGTDGATGDAADAPAPPAVAEALDPSVAKAKAKAAAKAAAAAAAQAAKPRVLSGPEFQLTFSHDEDFRYVHSGLCSLPQTGTTDGRLKDLPQRVTWRLRRCGRIRMPFAAALLEQYTAGVSRRAFELDYMHVPAPKAKDPDAPTYGDVGEGEATETTERLAADLLRREGFSREWIEALFGYVPDPVEADAAEPTLAGAMESEASAAPMTVESS